MYMCSIKFMAGNCTILHAVPQTLYVIFFNSLVHAGETHLNSIIHIKHHGSDYFFTRLQPSLLPSSCLVLSFCYYLFQVSGSSIFICSLHQCGICHCVDGKGRKFWHLSVCSADYRCGCCSYVSYHYYSQSGIAFHKSQGGSHLLCGCGAPDVCPCLMVSFSSAGVHSLSSTTARTTPN